MSLKPSKEIRKRAKAEGFQITEKEIDKILEFYTDHLFDRLSKGEEVRIKDIGKINCYVSEGKSMLTGKPVEYETVKFKFTPFTKVKSEAKERLSKVQKKYL